MTFEEAWEAARYNDWHAVVQAIEYGCSSLVGVVIGFTSLGPLYHVRWWLVAVASTILVLATTMATMRSIEAKWQLRFDAAKSVAEFQVAADRDGANRAFAPIIGGFHGAITSSICCGSALVVTSVRRRLDAGGSRRAMNCSNE